MTIPPYNPSVPESDDTIADGQQAFLTNFSTLFSAFGTNHIDLNDPTNPGNHNVIELIEQDIGRSTESQEIAIYSKDVGGQTDQIFMRYPLNGKEIQISNYQIYSIKETPAQKAFFTFLPGGIIVYFGRVNAFNNTNIVNIDLSPAICKNIMGVNLGQIARIQQKPNVSLKEVNGFYTTVVLRVLGRMTDQYYLIFGNT